MGVNSSTVLNTQAQPEIDILAIISKNNGFEQL